MPSTHNPTPPQALAPMATLKGPGEAQSFDGHALRIAIVHARWNTPIITSLVNGARAALLSSGVLPMNIVTTTVPGSYELPYAVQRIYAASQVQSAKAVSSRGGGMAGRLGDLLDAGVGGDMITMGGVMGGEKEKKEKGVEEGKEGSSAAFDAVLAIGVLIKGETMHFEYIADAVSHGLMRVQLDQGVPVVFGLLTVLTEEQAMVRAGMQGGGHNHGEDWGRAAVELGAKRKVWAEGNFL